MVKNLPANAGDTGSSPAPVRSHMPRSSLSPRAAANEAHTPRARAPEQEKPPQWEARAPQGRVAPAAATKERLRAAMKTQYSQK